MFCCSSFSGHSLACNAICRILKMKILLIYFSRHFNHACLWSLNNICTFIPIGIFDMSYWMSLIIRLNLLLSIQYSVVKMDLINFQNKINMIRVSVELLEKKIPEQFIWIHEAQLFAKIISLVLFPFFFSASILWNRFD